MPILGDDLDGLLQLLYELGLEDLTERESDFIDSMQERADKFQEKTFLSPAQEQWLNNLANKYGLKPL